MKEYINKDTIPKVTSTKNVQFIYVNDGEIKIDKDANDDRIFIGQPQKIQINLGTTLLQSVGLYQDDFKPYLFSGLLGDKFKSSYGVGQLMDHVLYSYPLDRSYIPQAGFPRLQQYMSGKFWGGQTDKYLHLRVNKPGGLGAIAKSLYNAAKGVEVVGNVFGKVQNTLQQVDNLYDKILTGVDDDQFYGKLNFPLFQSEYNDDAGVYIPIYKTLWFNRKKTPLGQISPIALEKYEIQDFKKDYIQFVEQLTQQNEKTILDRQNVVRNNLIRFNLSQKYFSHEQQPTSTLYNFDSDTPTRSVRLFANRKIDSEEFDQSYLINDPLSYQIQSYKTQIFDDSSRGTNDYKTGNIVKFWIEDVNNSRYMATPAFFSDLKDGGLQGQWSQIDYNGSMYPKFKYNGVDKRTISFTLKLGCFDKKYLPQYIQKLNFLRLVGSPSYKTITLPQTNKKFSFPKAPIYKLTLGDIVKYQYGYFQECSFQWPDELAIWNLDKKRTYNATYNSEVFSQLANQPDQIQIPIYTQVVISFVCIYGRGFSNNDQIYYNDGWKKGFN